MKFNNAPLSLVAEDVADYYNIQLEITDQTLKSCLFTTDFEDEPLEVVLRTLERGFNCKIKPTGHRAYQLIGGKCQ
jgi:ferric-dicitrate binding protein FerR (iron transport regulator)